MKISVLLAIAALIVAVVANPTPAEDQVAAAPLIFSEITPYLESTTDVEKRQGIFETDLMVYARSSSIVNRITD